jgi:hypothetical protein
VPIEAISPVLGFVWIYPKVSSVWDSSNIIVLCVWVWVWACVCVEEGSGERREERGERREHALREGEGTA